MYKIINTETGDTLTYVDEPLYVRKADNGAWQPCSEEDAQAISVPGIIGLCSLFGREKLPDDEYDYIDMDTEETVHVVKEYPFVMAREADAGELVYENKTVTDVHTEQIETVENGIIEQALNTEMRVGDIEDGLVEQSLLTQTMISDLEDGLDAQAASTEERIADIEQALCEMMLMQEAAINE